jgi:soluble lytic murein transglycosylase-like protein
MRSRLFFCRPEIKRLLKLTIIIGIFFLVSFLSKNKIIAITLLEKESINPVETNTFSGLSTAYNNLITQAGEKHGVDPELIRLVISQESGFKAAARSHKNAQGLMQLIPETAQRFGVKRPWDPKENIEGGTRYLKWLLNYFDGDVKLALAGYNAGENAVKKYGNKVPPYKETRNYVKKIASAYGKTYHSIPISSPTNEVSDASNGALHTRP